MKTIFTIIGLLIGLSVFGQGIPYVVNKNGRGTNTTLQDAKVIGSISGTNSTATISNMWDRGNVKFWNAKGDGVTDDTTPIRNAVSNNPSGTLPAAMTGGEVRIPRGIYKVTQSIVLTPGTILVGDSSDSTMIVNYGTNNDVITYNADLWSGSVVHRVGVKHLSISQAAWNTNQISGAAISFRGTATNYVKPIIDDVKIYDNSWVGIYVTNAIQGSFKDFTIYGTKSDGLLVGGRSTAMRFQDGFVNYAGGWGYNHNGHYGSYVSCAADGCTNGGYRVQGQGVTIISPSCEVNDGIGIYLTNVYGSTVISPVVFGNYRSTAGIWIEGGGEVGAGGSVSIINPYMGANLATNAFAIIATNTVYGIAPWCATIDGGYFASWGRGVLNDTNMFASIKSNNGNTRYQVSPVSMAMGPLQSLSVNDSSDVLVSRPVWSQTPLAPNHGTLIQVGPMESKFLLYSNAIDNWAGLGADSSGDFWVRTGTSNTNTMEFKQDGSLTLNNGLNVSPAGNLYVPGSIGVSTNNPQTALHVVGNVEIDTTTNSTGTDVKGQLPIVIKGVTYYIDLKK